MDSVVSVEGHSKLAAPGICPSKYGSIIRPVLFVIGVTLSGHFLVRIRLNWLVLPVQHWSAPRIVFFVTMGGL